MVEKPSSYDFRRRFLNGLSYGIRHWVLDYGLAPETAEVDSILQLALQVETSSQYTSRNTPTTSRDNTTKSSDGHAASSRSKPQSHTSSRTAPSHNHKQYAQHNVPAKPPHRRSSNSVVRFNPASTQHKSAYNPGSQSARSATPANRGTAFKPKPKDRSTIKCYGCGGFGHMANNWPYLPGKAHAAARGPQGDGETRGVTVTGMAGKGTVSRFCTLDHTATRHRGMRVCGGYVHCCR